MHGVIALHEQHNPKFSSQICGFQSADMKEIISSSKVHFSFVASLCGANVSYIATEFHCKHQKFITKPNKPSLRILESIRRKY